MNVHHNLPHWNYYKLLERDLEGCFRYVQPCKDHFDVYSDEFARIILMSATEIENAIKSFALHINYAHDYGSIHDYFNCVTSEYPSICNVEIIMPRYSMSFKPWDGWSASSAPDWWSMGYNKVKHDRSNHPSAPTMIRAINSLGALQVFLLHYYRKLYGDCYIPAEIAPQLMWPLEENDPYQGASQLWRWNLPDD